MSFWEWPGGFDRCGLFLGFLGMWVVNGVVKVFGQFERSCGFPASVGVCQIGWLGISGREMGRLAS